ncbi:MAG: site-specific DNA-methyltransferase [Bacteroidetes bacterium]|nr:site-specific DNA-methyltransferase [Bacteroidota bacterium]
MSNEQKITTDIKVPNKDLEALRINFPHCFDKDGNFQLEKFKNNLTEKEINFSTESYGLEWLGKSYARLLASDPATTLLKADETHNAKPENANSENLLIKGDNLEVLKHLANAYYEQVKMIYIDPPYNTGSDGFVYEDDRKFTVKELQQLIGIDAEKAKRILDFTKQESNSHSAWLTFIYPRLYIAKQLIKNDGVIFVSIDDNEVAQLRLLMDEVFGEENFVAIFPWKKRTAKSDVPYGISQDYEWIICYCKNYFNAGFDVERKYYKTDDYPNNRWRLSDLTTQKVEHDRPNSAFDLIDPKSKKIYKYNPKRLWGITKDTFDEYYRKGKIVFPDDYDFLNITIPAFRVFESEDKAKALKKYGSDNAKKSASTYLPKEVGMSEDGNRENFEIFKQKTFSFPKPSSLIKHLLRTIYETDFIILDFFAGSGTTGDAVMQLNAEDGGKRNFILVQLPEPIDPKKNKAAFDFVKTELKAEPTIFEITKERLIRASKKIKTETIDKQIAEKQKEIRDLSSKLDLENKNEKIKQLKSEIKALEQQDLGFKIFETIPIWEDYNFEAELFDSSQNLFDAGKLTEDDIKAILTTWKTYDGIALTQELESIDLSGYTAYYGNGRLYLMLKSFTTDSLKALLEKIDTDKHFEPKSIIAFGYHLESKSLREISENVKTYNNKKKSDIDFITRY